MSVSASADIGAAAARPPLSRHLLIFCGLGLLFIALAVMALGLGRYAVSPDRVAAILVSLAAPVKAFWTPVDEQIVLTVRLPRILLAGLSGAGLGLCGAALQGIYRNPLVEPSIVGAAPGAAFGGALALLIAEGSGLLGFAFAGGVAALALVHLIAGFSGRMSVLALVLAGVVVGAFFSALVSLTQYLANPETTLPAIVYWLMGSFATATWAKLAIAAPLVLIGAVGLWLLRFRIDVLSLGDEEAAALGVRVAPTRAAVLGLIALVTAAVVASCGVVSWVGLIAPHLARMLVGPAHRLLLPAAAMIGAILLVAVDTVARTATAAEVPLSVLTALIGTPIFAVLLRRLTLQGWNRDRD
ncbi:MAG: iron ABC transporter permease [Rhizobiales bacterium]|nr:iron ABC transporter permease [Hyphomicrobiales bacterium]